MRHIDVLRLEVGLDSAPAPDPIVIALDEYADAEALPGLPLSRHRDRSIGIGGNGTDYYWQASHIENPRFTNGSIAGWTAGGTVAPTVEHEQFTDDTNGSDNTGSLKIIWGAGDGYARYTLTGLTPGRTYRASARAFVPSGSTPVALYCNGVTGAATGTVDNWLSIEVTFTATTASHHLRVVPVGTPAAGDVANIDFSFALQSPGLWAGYLLVESAPLDPSPRTVALSNSEDGGDIARGTLPADTTSGYVRLTPVSEALDTYEVVALWDDAFNPDLHLDGENSIIAPLALKRHGWVATDGCGFLPTLGNEVEYLLDGTGTITKTFPVDGIENRTISLDRGTFEFLDADGNVLTPALPNVAPDATSAIRVTLTVDGFTSFPGVTLTADSSVFLTLSNSIVNHSGEHGGAGWLSPVEDTYVEEDAGLGWLSFVNATGASVPFYSFDFEVEPGDYIASGWETDLNDLNPTQTVGTVTIEFLDANGAVLSATAPVNSDRDGARHYVPATLIPASTVTARWRFDTSYSGFNALMRRITVCTHADPAQLASLPFIPGRLWQDVLGPTHEIKIVREALNVGTLSATILDSALDPAQADSILEVGAPVRVVALDATTGEFLPLYTGEITNAQTTYVGGTRISLTASDAVRQLAATPSPVGANQIKYLGSALEHSKVLYSLNGAGFGSYEANALALGGTYNENASAVDQVALCRDSVLGYAWVDQSNVLQVWDNDRMPGNVGTFDESVYSTLDVGFNTDSCVNDVRLVALRLTQDEEGNYGTEEVALGSYVDPASIRRFGRHVAEFKVMENGRQWTGDTLVWITADDFAGLILAANATAVVRINSVQVPIRETSDITQAGALVDLYDLVTLGYADTSTLEDSRVTRVEHVITPTKWTMTLGFEVDGAVATPQITPKPPTPRPTVAATPSIKRHKTGDMAISTSTFETIDFGTESWNTGHFDYNAGVFTVQEKGIYHIEAAARFATGTSPWRRIISIDVNGAEYIRHDTASDSVPGALPVSAIVRLDVGDTFKIQVWQNSGANLTLNGGEPYVHCAAVKVGDW